MTDAEIFKQAAAQAEISSCKKAKCGSIVVTTDKEIIGRGYNAPPLGLEPQRKCDWNPNLDVKPKYDKTCCVHAEWNAILDACKNAPDKIRGSYLYFMRLDQNNKLTDAGAPFCTTCSRLALQSGIAYFVLQQNGKPKKYSTEQYNLLSYNFYEK